MKKKLAILTAAALCLGLAGCGAAPAATSSDTATTTVPTAGNADKVSVVSTIFPSYDWAKEIVGETEGVDLTLLIDNGVDLHSYEPSVEDIAKISTADVFIYVGGESDGWVDDVLSQATNPDMVVINMMDVLADDIKEEEIVEGMEAEEEEEEGEEEEVEYDEHVWLSLNNAEKLVSAIQSALSKVDADNAAGYEANANAYITELQALDTEYKTCVSNAKRDTFLFADRFPFRYLAEDYNLNYYAAFVGCSADTEASFETVAFLANKVDELQLPVILTIETSDGKLAKTVLDSTKSKDAQLLVLDSLQNTKLSDNKSYLDVMRSNLDVLKTALN
ncbi:MAG: zinc ABC transporter substrate-binding protein [Lachnospiraceae bacterium]|nr:zinc ABC transporter substrate-binding protein [Lachnospiraceae bacterium]